MTKKATKVRISIKSRSEDDINRTINEISTRLKNHQIEHGGPIPFPSKNKKIIVNNSCHVYSKSKEKLSYKCGSRSIYAKFKEEDNISIITSDQSDWCPASVHLNISTVK